MAPINHPIPLGGQKHPRNFRIVPDRASPCPALAIECWEIYKREWRTLGMGFPDAKTAEHNVRLHYGRNVNISVIGEDSE